MRSEDGALDRPHPDPLPHGRGRVGGALYDTIGQGCGELRRPDPRIAAAILAALGPAASVVNVGAGAGS
jgi:hypothetical protein